MCHKYKDRAVSANIRTFGEKNKDAMLVSANTKAMAKIRKGGKVFEEESQVTPLYIVHHGMWPSLAEKQSTNIT